MEEKNLSFLSRCAQTDFGSTALSKSEKAFYERLNGEMLSLCRSLPDSVQTDSLLFLMQYSRIGLGEELDFFSNYYPPSWSVLYWLSSDDSPHAKRLKKKDVTGAVTAQSMAMFLHSLDDHLTDHQISISPLTLLLRSQAWTIMNRAFCNLAEGIPGGNRTVKHFIAEYYSSVQNSEKLDSINRYCDAFRGQMGLGMIAPTLLSMKRNGGSGFTRDLQMAYGSFGIAWRLLDDIKDMGVDMEKGAPSAVSFCLSEKLRNHWKNSPLRPRAAAKAAKKTILSHVLEHRVIDRVKARICAELDTAASRVEAYGLTGFARELRCLAQPLREGGRTQEEHHGKHRLYLA